MADDDKKPNSQLIQEEAERRYKEAREHMHRAESRRDPLSAVAGQMQFSFGSTLGSLAIICKNQEEIVERLKHLERAVVRSGHADTNPPYPTL